MDTNKHESNAAGTQARYGFCCISRFNAFPVDNHAEA
jgi:hypothetical protein